MMRKEDGKRDNSAGQQSTAMAAKMYTFGESGGWSVRLQMYVVTNPATTEILDLDSTGMSPVSLQGPGWIPRASLLPVEWLAMAIIKEMDLDSVVIRRVEVLDVNQAGQVLALLLG